jgi:hypothetical protein
MHRNRLPGIVAAALLTIAARAEPGAQTPNRDFDWIAGHWCGERNGSHIEEQWLAARGGVLLGLSRTVKGDKTLSFEFMRIEIGAETRFVAQPQGNPPTPFKLTASGPGWARFENPAHDFPNRVEYRRTANGLHAEIAGPDKDGKAAIIPFEYAVCPA